MLIKAADDKQPQINALEALLARPDVDAQTRRRIEQEVRMIRAGASGERDAAYEIEFHLGANKNQMTVRDLRIEVDGRVAQIDRLIINRLLDVWVCESKHFAEGVAINEHGEWVAFYGNPFQRDLLARPSGAVWPYSHAGTVPRLNPDTAPAGAGLPAPDASWRRSENASRPHPSPCGPAARCVLVFEWKGSQPRLYG